MNSAVAQKGRPVSEARVSIDLFIDIFFFLSVLLIGADRWGVELLGVNLRLDQLFLCVFTVLMMIKGAYRFTQNIWIFAFLFFSLISSLLAVSIARGILYYFSILYNVVFVFYSFASYVRTFGLKKFLRLFRITCYVQCVLLTVQFLLKVLFGYEFPFLPDYGEYNGILRFQLWFYEPSYLATYLSFWFALSLYMLMIAGKKSYIADVIAALLMFVISTSSSGFIAIALSFAIIYVIWLLKGITRKKLLLLFLIAALVVAFRLIFSHLYNTFIERLFSGSLNTASGGRIEGWRETFQVFLENPFFGVGPGNYGLYLGKGNDYVPTNVTLDALSTLGIFGFVSWAGITVSLVIEAIRRSKGTKSEEKGMLLACVFGLLIFTVILQINQGYLRLYHWMFFGALWGGILRMKRLARQGEKKTAQHSEQGLLAANTGSEKNL